MTYDQSYKKNNALFGNKEETILKKFAHYLNIKYPVLDIGAGQGRNSFFLARNGYTVHSIEPSIVAAKALDTLTENEQLHIKIFQTTFEEFKSTVEFYSGILVFGLIPDLKWNEIMSLISLIDNLTCKNSIVWITGFNTQDPAYRFYKSSFNSIGLNSFENSQGLIRTYLLPNQILELFDKYKILYHWEGLGTQHRHGNAPPERHSIFQAVFQKIS